MQQKYPAALHKNAKIGKSQYLPKISEPKTGAVAQSFKVKGTDIGCADGIAVKPSHFVFIL